MITTSVSPCAASANGSVKIYASGGVAPLEYSDGGNYGAGNTFLALPGGPLNISVKDKSGRMHDTTVTIPAPAPISLTVTPVDLDTTAKGSITIVAAGGAGLKQYSDNRGNTIINPPEYLTILTPELIIYMLRIAWDV